MLPRSGSRADRALAVGLVLVAVATACPRAAKRAQPSPTPSAGGCAPRGGEAVVAYPHEPATLDPLARAGDGTPTRDLARLLMPALRRVGPAGTSTPWLLAEPAHAESGPPFSVVVTLRPDAVWSDGRRVTVADLRSTWRRARRAPGAIRDGYDRIDRIDAETPSRARIVFREPFRRWENLFSAGLGVLPAHVRARDLDRRWPVSGGPFVLRRWRRHLDMTFERNPRAPARDAPCLDRLRVVFVPDGTSALELLRRRRVDALAGYNSIEFARRAREAGATVSTDRGPTWAGLWMRTDRGALRERAVRRALADALDRDRIVRGLVGEGGERIDAPPPVATGFDPDGSVSRARRTLRDAGWRGSDTRRKDGRALSVSLGVIGSDGLAVVVARAIQRQASRAGIDVRPVPLDADRFWSDWLAGSRMEIALVVRREAPSGGVPPLAVPGNLARLRDTRLRALVAAADRDLTAADPFAAASDRVVRLAPVVPLYAASVRVATRATLERVRSSASADGPFWNAQEWARA